MDLVNIRGLLVPISEKFKMENIEAMMNYRPKDGDIIISTYPKTGTTWVQYIVWQILHKADSFPSFEDAMFRLMPYMEMVGEEAVNKLLPPRFYKTHFPYNNCNINPNCKYIYVHRHPMDTVVSYYYFYNDMTPESHKKMEFDTLFENFLSGEIGYGDFFDHVLSFYVHKNDDNVLFLSYENLKCDTEAQILKIAKFLGDEYFHNLTNDVDLLRKIVMVTSFDYMKNHLKMKRFDEKGKEKDLITDNTKDTRKPPNFFRKGIIGDGKSHLSLEQQEKLMAKISKKMEGTELLDAWQRY